MAKESEQSVGPFGPLSAGWVPIGVRICSGPPEKFFVGLAGGFRLARSEVQAMRLVMVPVSARAWIELDRGRGSN